MSHLTMCHDLDCPSARSCQRSPESGTKESPDGQSWGDFNRRFLVDKCGYFLARVPYDQIQRRAVRCNTCQRFVTHPESHTCGHS
jgi:hypothetical protein